MKFSHSNYAPRVQITLRLSPALAEKLTLAALGRNTSGPKLAQSIVETALNDDMINAILDDGD